MPCKVKANPKGGYDIVGPTGKVEGHSDTLPSAQASCRIRNEAGSHGKSKKSEEESDSDSS